MSVAGKVIITVNGITDKIVENDTVLEGIAVWPWKSSRKVWGDPGFLECS